MSHATITGLGAVTCAGLATADLERVLRCGTPRPHDCYDDQTPCARAPTPVPTDLIESSLDLWACDPGVASKLLLHASDRVLRAVAAVAQAWRDADLVDRPITPDRIGLIVAATNSTTHELAEAIETEHRNARLVRPTAALRLLETDVVGVLSELFGMSGEGSVVSGASASGNVATIAASRLIACGSVDACVVVGSAPELVAAERAAYANIGARATRSAGAPFSADRVGFVPATGAAAVVLEDHRSAVQRGVSIQRPRLVGYSARLDATSSAAPSRAAEVGVMSEAIERAGLSPIDVDYVNTHGSGSPLGDSIEAQAIADVFGTGADGPRVNATKAFTGHTLAAAGVVELVATCIQLRHGFLHHHAGRPDPALERLRFHVDTDCLPGRIETALSNSFGFGGFNSTLVVAQ